MLLILNQTYPCGDDTGGDVDDGGAWLVAVVTRVEWRRRSGGDSNGVSVGVVMGMMTLMVAGVVCGVVVTEWWPKKERGERGRLGL
nr:hypothetical protein [Tanacetum cinerariifolium]